MLWETNFLMQQMLSLHKTNKKQDSLFGLLILKIVFPVADGIPQSLMK